MLNIAGLLTAEVGFGTLVLVVLVPGLEELLTAALELEAVGPDLNALMFGPEKLLIAALELEIKLDAVCQSLKPWCLVPKSCPQPR